MRSILALLMTLGAAGLSAQALVVNLGPTHPVFHWKTTSGVSSVTLPPGQGMTLVGGELTVPGLGNLPLADGEVLYQARIGGRDVLYRLGPLQTLVVNQSGRPLTVRLAGDPKSQALAAEGLLASGSFALAEWPDGLLLSLDWSDGAADTGTSLLEAGHLYRLLPKAPESEVSRWE
ncbi:MAG: hypothetical protein WCG80_07465 [Spirochaetales bacterium]